MSDVLNPAPPPGPNLMSPADGAVADAGGGITYEFAGHVHAQGLDLDASPSTTPADNNNVRWLRTSDGAVVADLWAYEPASGIAPGIFFEAIGYTGGVPPTEERAADLRSSVHSRTTGAVLKTADVSALAHAAPTPSEIVVDCDGTQRLLLNAAGVSDYETAAHAAATYLLAVIAGARVNAGRANVSTAASVGGSVTVNHGIAAPFVTGAAPIVLASVNGAQAPNFHPYTNTIGNTQFTLGIRHVDNVATTQTVDVQWLAIG